jgi:hypothetical protein
VLASGHPPITGRHRSGCLYQLGCPGRLSDAAQRFPDYMSPSPDSAHIRPNLRRGVLYQFYDLSNTALTRCSPRGLLICAAMVRALPSGERLHIPRLSILTSFNNTLLV